MFIQLSFLLYVNIDSTVNSFYKNFKNKITVQNHLILNRNFIKTYIYPKAVSNTIIITKPKATPTVPILECSPPCDSGISSSTTT